MGSVYNKEGRKVNWYSPSNRDTKVNDKVYSVNFDRIFNKEGIDGLREKEKREEVNNNEY